MGTKILINRIEKMFMFLLIPTSIFIINSLILIVSLIVEQKQEVYIFIFTVYSISAFIIILIYLLFRINNRIGWTGNTFLDNFHIDNALLYSTGDT